MRSNKWFSILAFSVFLVFAGVDLSEGFIHHHHETTEDSDCAYCGFHKAVSNSDISAAPVEIIPYFLIVSSVFVLLPTYHFTRLITHSGRAPPAVLS